MAIEGNRAEFGLTGVTAALRDVMHASREVTGRLATRLGMPATDVEAVGLLQMLGPTTVGGLAERLNIRTPSATVLVDRLVAAGRAERRPHPADRRSTLVHVTEQARTESWAVWEPVVRAMDEVAAGLPADQQNVVAGYLTQVAATMRAARPRGERAGQ